MSETTPANNCASVQHKRGTAADIAAHNPMLAEGEFGVETDTFKVKVGDGTKTWTALPYIGGAGIRVDTLSNLATQNPELSPKEFAVGYVPNADYAADTAPGQYVIKINQSPTDRVTWSNSVIAPLVPSNTRGITGAATITNMVSLTNAQYTALATKNASTLYIIVD
jgi:hypothetical protein